MSNVKVIAVDFHRNGVDGEGFFAVRFDADGRRLIAIAFHRSKNLAVLDVDCLNKDVVHHRENNPRGEYYAPEIWRAIKAWEKDINETPVKMRERLRKDYQDRLREDVAQETRGHEFYEEIGHKGGQKIRELILAGKKVPK